MPLRTLKTIQPALARFMQTRSEILVGYIFGSVATGRARRDSDIDVAVLLSSKVTRGDAFACRIELMGELMSILERDDVDLIVLNDAPALLAHRVLSKGKLIFERSPSARVAFQVRTVNRYLDSQPMRNLYLTYLKKQAREGKILG